jgi:hypothetical protein
MQPVERAFGAKIEHVLDHRHGHRASGHVAIHNEKTFINRISPGPKRATAGRGNLYLKLNL